MPRFELRSEAIAKSAEKTDVRAFDVVTNTPALRYALVPQKRAASSRGGTDRLVVLIVPD